MYCRSIYTWYYLYGYLHSFDSSSPCNISWKSNYFWIVNIAGDLWGKSLIIYYYYSGCSNDRHMSHLLHWTWERVRINSGDTHWSGSQVLWGTWVCNEKTRWGRVNKCTAVAIVNMAMIVSCDTVSVDLYGCCDCCVVGIICGDCIGWGGCSNTLFIGWNP